MKFVLDPKEMAWNVDIKKSVITVKISLIAPTSGPPPPDLYTGGGGGGGGGCTKIHTHTHRAKGGTTNTTCETRVTETQTHARV